MSMNPESKISFTDFLMLLLPENPYSAVLANCVS
jgi:hypothetical protein